MTRIVEQDGGGWFIYAKAAVDGTVVEALRGQIKERGIGFRAYKYTPPTQPGYQGIFSEVEGSFSFAEAVEAVLAPPSCPTCGQVKP